MSRILSEHESETFLLSISDYQSGLAIPLIFKAVKKRYSFSLFIEVQLSYNIILVPDV